MMMKDLKAAMAASISEVLETMFYMPLEFEGTGDPVKRGFFDMADIRSCRLTFKGALNGTMVIIIPESLLVPMAVDFMAEEKENIARIHTDGILKEILNMVLGHMLSSLDARSDFHLGIPELLEDDSLIRAFRDSLPECHVLVESVDGLILCILVLDD